MNSKKKFFLCFTTKFCWNYISCVWSYHIYLSKKITALERCKTKTYDGILLPLVCKWFFSYMSMSTCKMNKSTCNMSMLENCIQFRIVKISNIVYKWLPKGLMLHICVDMQLIYKDMGDVVSWNPTYICQYVTYLCCYNIKEKVYAPFSNMN